MNTQFSRFQLDPELLANLTSLGYLQMTPIQQAALPHLLAGKDLIAQAKTGSGKTVAFGLGLLSRIDRSHFGVQALVLCPTRELADQVTKELRRLARASANIKMVTLCGGAPFAPQASSLEHGAHIVVGTPGRLLKHLSKGGLKLEQVHTLVLDEADRMLDMGFYDEMLAILTRLPPLRQTLLFSATYPDSIHQLSKAFQLDPVEVRVESTHTEGVIRQVFHEVEPGKRTRALLALLATHRPVSTLVFCNTRQQCDELSEALQQQGIQASALHGDLEQAERDQVLVRFANRSIALLVATDVAARGLDIKELEAVINFDLPRDPEVYIHRIGRTGRAGGKGLALSLYLASEVQRLIAIEAYLQTKVQLAPMPGLDLPAGFSLPPPMITLRIDGGRRDKVRAGDILGALTAHEAVTADKVGKIDIFDHIAYVAIDRSVRKKALQLLSEGKIKGRRFRVRAIH